MTMGSCSAIRIASSALPGTGPSPGTCASSDRSWRSSCATTDGPWSNCFERDPISRFKLKSEDYLHMGEMIAGLARPTLFVMEGGYAVEEIGLNAVNVLTGFEQNAR